MNFSTGRNQRRNVEISVVPLIDLFLNILVFFLVTTTFSLDSVFMIDLPQAKESDQVSHRKQMMVFVSQTGEIAINRTPTDLSGLRKELDQVPSDQRMGFPVMVRADQKAFHGIVISVLDVIRQEGFRNVGMATRTEEE